MGEATKIEWCHHTFNPWWGCVRVSPGCEHCYAEAFAKRVGQKVWGVQSPRRFFGDKHWDEPLKWNKQAAKDGVRRRVFCASMADVFEDRDDLKPHRERLWSLIESTPCLDWLLLTKRPENAERLKPAAFWWPNIWLGTTAEDQRRADERVPLLLGVPVATRFVSYEPALGPVDFFSVDGAISRSMAKLNPRETRYPAEALDWIIVGGESGPGARPFDIQWARDTVEQCSAAGVACFVKQLGSRPHGWCVSRLHGDDPIDDYEDGHCDIYEASDGPTCSTGCRLMADRKGGDMAEWPEDLRVRKFPEARHA